VLYIVLETVIDVTIYDLSLKVIDTTLVFALMHRMVDHRSSGSGVNGYDVSVKVAQLSGALYAPKREEQRSNHD
jgi:hypothetical protein